MIKKPKAQLKSLKGYITPMGVELLQEMMQDSKQDGEYIVFMKNIAFIDFQGRMEEILEEMLGYYIEIGEQGNGEFFRVMVFQEMSVQDGILDARLIEDAHYLLGESDILSKSQN